MSQKESKLEFALRKLQSLSGFLPLCVFLMFHLVANAVIMISPGYYYKFINTMATIPGLIVIELVIIFLPLILHGCMGLYIVFTGRNNPKRYPYFRNWAFLLQRISGVVIFAFLIYHVLTIKYGSDHSAATMILSLNAQFNTTWSAIFYVIALICVSFHVCNGLWGFAINWGILVGMRAQKVFGYVCIVLFIILLIFWLFVMMNFLGLSDGVLKDLFILQINGF